MKPTLFLQGFVIADLIPEGLTTTSFGSRIAYNLNN